MFDFKSIDIKSLITEALDIERARKTVVSVQVLLDETASPEFQVFVRSGFSSSSVNSRLTVGYYPSQDISVMEGTDLVVMAAGQTSETGADRGNYPSSRYPRARYRRARQSGHPECEGCGSSASERCAHLASRRAATRRRDQGQPCRQDRFMDHRSRSREALVVLAGLSVRSSSARAKMRFSSLLRRMPALVCLCSFLAPICPL